MSSVPNPRATAQAAWRTELEACVALVKAHMGETYHATIAEAVTLIATGTMTLAGDGLTATVHQPDGTAWTLTDSQCPCGSTTWCAHLLARALLRKVQQRLAANGQASPAPEADAPPEGEAPLDVPETPLGYQVPAEYLITIKGKQFVLYAGLRWLAGQHGLVARDVEPISVTAELAVFQAIATFDTGRRWSEIGDASPDNVGKSIAPHFIRMAAGDPRQGQGVA